ncbi:adhesion G-protein coupled receptor G6-like [Octopus vulgaris]|uniref:Adhesion G-protein coupled receptor G6-like n=1 Tax=Octopus vulgaris TaxID=6645 RepID=A0AA36AMX5_OCTVU|nr:adhesion G-protein coupled receptor G6-like [Octopus vulgaris]
MHRARNGGESSYSTALDLGIPTSPSNTTQKCKLFTGVWQKPKMSLCNNTEWITQKLKDIDGQDINEGNIEKFSRQLRNISEKSLYFKEEDFNLAVDIHEKMVPLISRVSTNITLNNILLSINNMEDTPERILNGAEQAGRSVTRMLDIIETIPDQISLEEQQVTVLYSNLGIGVIKVENDTFNGSSFGVLPGNPETKAKTLVIQTSSTKEYNKSTSHIISANIPNIQITNLNEPVTVSFSSVYQNQQCAYWDESSDQKPRWSTNGCKTSTYVPGEKVVCSCNHLTSFTLLAVAALLHYSLTATVMWMGIEAFHDYTDYKNLELNEKYFMIVSSILAWGLPAVITLAVNYTNNYISVAQVLSWLLAFLAFDESAEVFDNLFGDKLRSDDRRIMRMQGVKVVRKRG